MSELCPKLPKFVRSFPQRHLIIKELGLNDRQVKAVLYVKEKGKITNSEYQEINSVSKRTATNDLTELVNEFAALTKIGTSGSNIWYELVGQVGQWLGNNGANGASAGT